MFIRGTGQQSNWGSSDPPWEDERGYAVEGAKTKIQSAAKKRAGGQAATNLEGSGFGVQRKGESPEVEIFGPWPGLMHLETAGAAQRGREASVVS